LPEIISKLSQRIIAAHVYFPTCSMSLKQFWNNFRTPSAAEIILCQFQTQLHVKVQNPEIVSKLFQCFIARVITVIGYMW